MKYGVYVPNHGDFFDTRFIAQLARETEEAGWDGFFVWDHIAHPHYLDKPFADPWVHLTAAALATEKIKLGPMVTPISRRRPWKLAKETVTLDHLSGGRLILGVGLGTHPVEFSNLGESGEPKVRAEMLDEGLAVLAGLWQGETFEYHGSHFDIAPTQLLPATLQKPRIPIWVAGIWPKKGPFARSCRWDGYFPLGGIRDSRFLVPETFSEIRNLAMEKRGNEVPYDLVASGYTTGTKKSEESAFVQEFADAGATWWMEAMDPWMFTGAQSQARIRLGPPR